MLGALRRYRIDEMGGSMINRRHFLELGAAATALALLAGCTGGAGGDDEAGTSGGTVTGEITVLTNRTDLAETTLPAYAKKFEAKYPGTKVSFEAVTNYEGDVTT